MSVRLDKWLWAARFFKTRSLARQAIVGGHVAVNGARAKPARTVSEGDRLDIRRGEQRFEIVVDVLSDRRGPASEAAGLYSESTESIERREREVEARRQQRAEAGERGRRPDKRQRRQIVRFQRKQR